MATTTKGKTKTDSHQTRKMTPIAAQKLPLYITMQHRRTVHDTRLQKNIKYTCTLIKTTSHSQTARPSPPSNSSDYLSLQLYQSFVPVIPSTIVQIHSIEARPQLLLGADLVLRVVLRIKQPLHNMCAEGMNHGESCVLCG